MEVEKSEVRRGASGAHIVRVDDTIIKRGDARVAWQGRWLMEHSCESLPRVYSVSDGVYTMEVLEESDRDSLRVSAVVKALFPIWNQRVDWIKKPLTPFFRDEALRYLLPKAMDHAPETPVALSDSLAFISRAYKMGMLKRCITHGDPTYDNTMIRYRNGKMQYVLIDPLPPSFYAPNLRAMDLGKILQSCAGYEFDRYGVGFSTRHRMREGYEDVIRMFGHMEAMCALRFALIHVIRALPYAPPDARERLRVNTLQNILTLL